MFCLKSYPIIIQIAEKEAQEKAAQEVAAQKQAEQAAQPAQAQPVAPANNDGRSA